MSIEKEKIFANAAHPLNWLEVAKIMYENANTLHDLPQGTITYNNGVRVIVSPISNRSVFLLAAFSMENLLKAFLVYENPNYIKDGKLNKEFLNGHSLSKLQQKCKKIPSPKRTLYIFKTLEEGVNSWARYPCATSIQRESEEFVANQNFWNAYNKAFELYSKRLEKLLAKKWKNPYGEIGYVAFK